MKKLNLFLLTGLVLSFASCDLIGGIFKAGAYTGIIAVVVVVALVLWLLSKVFRR